MKEFELVTQWSRVGGDWCYDTPKVITVYWPASQLIVAEWRIHVPLKLTIIVSDNGLAPGRRQAIIWTNAGMHMNDFELIGDAMIPRWRWLMLWHAISN